MEKFAVKLRPQRYNISFILQTLVNTLIDAFEVAQRFETDFDDSFDIDGINACLTRFESDGVPEYFFLFLHSDDRKDDICKEEVFRNQLEVALKVFTLHQTKRGVGILYPNSKHQFDNESQRLGNNDS